MKTLISFLLLLAVGHARAQESPNDRLRAMVAEAKRLYRGAQAIRLCERMMQRQSDSANGMVMYFSYPDGALDHVIACRPGADPVAIAGWVVDVKTDTSVAVPAVGERPLSARELPYHRVLEVSRSALQDKKFFRSEPGAYFRIIPLIDSL